MRLTPGGPSPRRRRAGFCAIRRLEDAGRSARGGLERLPVTGGARGRRMDSGRREQMIPRGEALIDLVPVARRTPMSPEPAVRRSTLSAPGVWAPVGLGRLSPTVRTDARVASRPTPTAGSGEGDGRPPATSTRRRAPSSRVSRRGADASRRGSARDPSRRDHPSLYLISMVREPASAFAFHAWRVRRRMSA
jgi:hypothetical protein